MSNAIKARLDAMSLSLLDKASDYETKLDQQLDVYKAVATYYLGTARATKGKLAGDGDDVPTFKSILAKVNGKQPPGEMQ